MLQTDDALPENRPGDLLPAHRAGVDAIAQIHARLEQVFVIRVPHHGVQVDEPIPLAPGADQCVAALPEVLRLIPPGLREEPKGMIVETHTLAPCALAIPASSSSAP